MEVHLAFQLFDRHPSEIITHTQKNKCNITLFKTQAGRSEPVVYLQVLLRGQNGTQTQNHWIASLAHRPLNNNEKIFLLDNIFLTFFHEG